MSSQKSYTVKLQAQTWSRVSHGLYDYESCNTIPASHQLLVSSRITREDSSIQVHNLSTVPSSSCESLFSILYHDGFPYITPTSEQIWLIVKDLPTQCILQENDVIKLGRMQMRVKELKGTTDDDSVVTQDSPEDDAYLDVPSERSSGQCRICLYEDSEPENPLITPCGCSGSVKYLHLQCLQKWIQSRKVTRESENSVSSYWNTTDCELCKSAFPLKIASQGKKFNLFHEDNLKSPGIVLESLNHDLSNGMYAISLINKFHVKLGRGHDSDVRISDISVSRIHASVEYKDSNFYFSDGNSKFGSLILVKEPLQLIPATPLHFQIGRSVFIVTLVET